MPGWVSAPFRSLWAICRGSWVDVGGGLRPGSGASALYLFLFLVFCLAGAVLLALGFDLERVDLWLDGHQTWFELAGAIAFKAVLAVVSLACLVIAAAGVHARLGAMLRPALRRGGGAPAEGARAARPDTFGWGAISLALVVGYFAARSLFAGG